MRFITSRCPVKPCLVKYFKWLLKVIKDKEALHRVRCKGFKQITQVVLRC